jgi:hypothetical protein
VFGLTFQPDVALLEPEVALLEPEVALLEPEVALLEPEVALLEPEVALLEPEVALLKLSGSIHFNKDLTFTIINFLRIKINGTLYRSFFKKS